MKYIRNCMPQPYLRDLDVTSCDGKHELRVPSPTLSLIWEYPTLQLGSSSSSGQLWASSESEPEPEPEKVQAQARPSPAQPGFAHH